MAVRCQWVGPSSRLCWRRCCGRPTGLSSVDRLIDAMWKQEPLATATTQVQSQVSRSAATPSRSPVGFVRAGRHNLPRRVQFPVGGLVITECGIRGC
jgi:hypothetical protein